jgi:SHS2 domain-containing protein
VKNYELLEHTADIRIRVKAKTLEELFINASLAVFDIISERKSSSESITEAIITQEAENTEELFINWLNELISLSAAREIVFTDFKFQKLTKNKLQALAFAEPASCFEIKTEIKAATYHGLKLSGRKGAFLAEVVLDV